MIKTIKVTKEFNFRELMEYIIQNDVSDTFISSDEKKFSVNSNGTFCFYDYRYDDGETYELEVEEEITEDMMFDVLIEVFVEKEEFDKTNAVIFHNKRIEDIKDVGFFASKKIYALIDGELKLVWERNSDE